MSDVGGVRGVNWSPERFGSREFAVTFGLRPERFAWFLGAGASAAGGVRTARDMILDFKAKLYCRHGGHARQEIDLSDPVWTDRVDDFIQKRGLLAGSSFDTEYADAFEAVCKTESERRLFIEAAIRGARPSFGHRVLAALMTMGKLRCVFTTNFDPLIEEAVVRCNESVPAANQVRATVSALDSAERAARCIREASWPLIVKLHGDYQSTSLKNTREELSNQDAQLRRALAAVCQQLGLMVVGYSGRDVSVLEALREALSGPTPFPGGITWVVRRREAPISQVIRFLHLAERKGVRVALVETDNFDEFAADLAAQVDYPEILRQHIFSVPDRHEVRQVEIPTEEALEFPVIRCNALLVKSLPSSARRLTLEREAPVAQLRELVKASGKQAVIGVKGRDVIAFGADRDLQEIFSSLGVRLVGSVALDPLADSSAVGLLSESLARALRRGLPLRPRLRQSGHALVVSSQAELKEEQPLSDSADPLSGLKRAYGSALAGEIPELQRKFAEGIRLKLEYVAGRWWCVFDPTTFVDSPKEQGDGTADSPAKVGVTTRGLPDDPAAEWRRERWAQKYNRQWAAILDAWARILTGSGNRIASAVPLRGAEGVESVFELSIATAWSRPVRDHEYFRGQRS